MRQVLTAADWDSLFFWSFSLTLVVQATGTKITGTLFINESFSRRFIVAIGMGMTLVTGVKRA